MANKYTNTASKAALVDAISSSATEVELSGFAGWPSATPYWAEIARGTSSAEVVLVTDVSGNLVTISRGQDGTVASSHNAGDSFEHVMPAYVPNLAEQHAEAEVAHGASSPLVGRDDAETLTNKTYRGAHTHTYSDTDPASVAAGFEVTADSAVARDGFAYHNTAADPDRAALRTTQSGADRVVIYADGTTSVVPSPAATRPALDVSGDVAVSGDVSSASATVAGDVSAGSATVSGAATVSGRATVGGLELPAPAAGETATRLVVRTVAGARAFDVYDDAGTLLFRIGDDATAEWVSSTGATTIRANAADGMYFYATGQSSARARIDGDVYVTESADPGESSPAGRAVKITPAGVSMWSSGGSDAGVASIQPLSSGHLLVLPPSGGRVLFGEPAVAADPTDVTQAETWHPLTLQNGWVHRTDMWQPAVKLQVDDGIVRLRGGCDGGTTSNGTTVFVLDAAYRPTKNVMVPVAASAARTGATPRLFIRTTGEAEIYTVDGGFSLDGVTYSVR